MKLSNNPLKHIMHISKAVERTLIRDVQTQCGISHTDAKILMTIAWCPGASQASLAESLQVSAPAVSRQVKKLEDLNWVERKSHPNNRRTDVLQLTKQGTTKAQEVETYLEQTLNQLINELPTISSQTKKDLANVEQFLGEQSPCCQSQ